MSGRKKHLYTPKKNRYGHPFALARSDIGMIVFNGAHYTEVHICASTSGFKMTLRDCRRHGAGVIRSQDVSAEGSWTTHTYAPHDAAQLKTRVQELIAMVTADSQTNRIGFFKFAPDNYGVLV